MKNTIRYFLIILFLALVLPVTYIVMETSGATIDTPQNKVIYTMPYPGILPDHPLYFVKIVRVRINEFMTRDQLKKAEIYLLYSDKRVAMAMALTKKGKNNKGQEIRSRHQRDLEALHDARLHQAQALRKDTSSRRKKELLLSKKKCLVIKHILITRILLNMLVINKGTSLKN